VPMFSGAVAMPTIVGSAARPPFAASDDEPVVAALIDMADGAAGDVESLQPTTDTASTATVRKPVTVFMTPSLVP
jgi:hypothetical protein